MKIKVSSSFTGVISTGSYENMRPGFSAEVDYEVYGECNGEAVNKEVDKAQKELQRICYENFKACEEQAILERIEKERKDIRFYYDENGVKVPSVTSIIGFDGDMYVSPDELQQYASQSNVAHAQIDNYIKTGQWVEPKELSEVWSDIVIVQKGSLGLPLTGWSFEGFLEKNPIKDMVAGEQSINMEHRYGGTPDFVGVPDFKDAKKVKTMFDVKRTPDKVKNFKQMAAYIKMKGYTDCEQMCIVPINTKTKQGFSRPIVETRINEYFGLFLKDRESFKKRFRI